MPPEGAPPLREDGCLFCRIIAGELASEVVAENEHAVAIRDVAPVAPTHLLVLPRAHRRDASLLGSEDAALLGELLSLANRCAVQEGIAEGGYRLVFNVGDDGGNTVAHLHLHVLGGRRLGWPPG